MKRITTWLASPALALLIMATSPMAMAGGKTFSKNAGQFRSNNSSNNVSRNFQLSSGIKNSRIGQNSVQPGKPFNPGSGGTIIKNPGVTLPIQPLNPGQGGGRTRTPKFGGVIDINPGVIVDPIKPPKGPIVIDPSGPILDPFPGNGGNGNGGNGNGGNGNGGNGNGGNGNGGNGNGGNGNGGNGNGGHGHGHGHHWPHHWGYCNNWYWGYGFNCPQVIPCALPTVTYVPAPVTVVEVPTNSVDGLFSSLDASGADLLVAQVQIVEAGNSQAGPLLRVLIANQGRADVTVPTRLAMISIKEAPATADSPRVVTDVKALRAGETTSVDVRMPVASNSLPKLVVAVEIPKSVVDIKPENNLAVGELSQLPVVTTAMK